MSPNLPVKYVVLSTADGLGISTELMGMEEEALPRVTSSPESEASLELLPSSILPEVLPPDLVACCIEA